MAWCELSGGLNSPMPRALPSAAHMASLYSSPLHLCLQNVMCLVYPTCWCLCHLFHFTLTALAGLTSRDLPAGILFLLYTAWAPRTFLWNPNGSFCDLITHASLENYYHVDNARAFCQLQQLSPLYLLLLLSLSICFCIFSDLSIRVPHLNIRSYSKICIILESNDNKCLSPFWLFKMNFILLFGVLCGSCSCNLMLLHCGPLICW